MKMMKKKKIHFFSVSIELCWLQLFDLDGLFIYFEVSEYAVGDHQVWEREAMPIFQQLVGVNVRLIGRMRHRYLKNTAEHRQYIESRDDLAC